MLAQLAATAPAAFVSHQSESADQGYTQRATNGGLTRSESTQSANMASGSGGSLTTSDLGLGYSYFDIGDHESEGEGEAKTEVRGAHCLYLSRPATDTHMLLRHHWSCRRLPDFVITSGEPFTASICDGFLG